MGRAQAKLNRVFDREALMMEFAPWIDVSIDRIRNSTRCPLDREDLFAAAVTGLFEALEHYDPMVDKSFKSFAERSMQRALIDEVRPTADFFQHVQLQPVGPAEALKSQTGMRSGYDRKGHKYRIH